MRKRRVFVVVLVVLLVAAAGLFAVYGVPLIEAMFTPPVTGLPPTSEGNSLRARFTQTALARTTVPGPASTPSGTAR